MTAIQVVIVSAIALTRGGLQQIIIQSGSRIEVAGLFDNLSDADAFLYANKARVLIADESPQYGNMIKDLKRLMEGHPGLAVILVMQRPTASLSQKLITIGVRALLHKEDDLEQTLNQAIQMSVTGNTTISLRISPFLDKAILLPAKITQRDLDMLQLLTEGLQTKEIAAHLGVKYGVVNRTLNKLMRVYSVQNLPQLGLMAQQILTARKKLE